MDPIIPKKEPYPPSLYGNLLQIVQNAILVINSQDRIIFANRRAAAMFATSQQELQNMAIDQLFMEDDREILVHNILHLSRQDGEFEGEAMLRRLDSSTFQGLLAATAFCWSEAVEGIALTIHDITEMKSIERTLRKSERLFFLGRMMDDISHQIRNPVMVIGGLSRRLDAQQACGKRIHAIQREASYLEALLDSLNSFIRLPKPCLNHNTVGEIIVAAESHFKEVAEEYCCSWQGEYDEHIAAEELIIDIDLILKALEAVVVSGCESYRGDELSKVIFFSVKRCQDETWPFVVTVRDQGCGIPAEQSPHIFFQFYTNKTKHIGMGLTFAQKILEEQMGKLEINSSPGQGTTVKVHLVKERRRPIRTTRLDEEERT